MFPSWSCIIDFLLIYSVMHLFAIDYRVHRLDLVIDLSLCLFIYLLLIYLLFITASTDLKRARIFSSESVDAESL